MKDVLIPLVGLIFIGLFAYAIIRAGRKQQKGKAKVFRDFANGKGLRYQEADDGKAQDFAHDLDGVGRFKSHSLGQVIPKDVVYGVMHGSEVILFRHSTRFTEGWTREWFITGVTSAETLAERCSVQFCKRWADKGTMYLQGPVVKEQKVGPFHLIVRATSPSHAGKIMDGDVLTQLAGLAGHLSFRPEIQIRGKRLAAYPADRNATLDDLETLGNLLGFAKSAAGVLEQAEAP